MWRRIEVLFMIVTEHTTETCPGGTIRPDKQFMNKTEESRKKSGVARALIGLLGLMRAS